MKKRTLNICLILLVCLAPVGQTFAGQIVEWGNNYYYAQGDVPVGSDFVAIATGRGNCIALKADGSLLSWGSPNLAKQDVPPGNDFIAIAAGRNHYLVLKSDGSLVAWGGNYYGQSNVPAGNDFVAIAAGSDHSIVLKTDGSLTAWGDNYYGQCNVPPGNDFVAITASTLWQDHGLVLKSDGSLVAWGRNNYGQCDVPAGNDFVAIAAGREHSLALKSDGSLVAWGRNNYGQCDVPAGNDFVAITAGGRHNLAIKSNGSLVGWGRNDKGQCDVPAGNDFVAIATETYGSLALVSEPAMLVRIEIVGPDDVRKNYQAQYKALAYYDDGRPRNATDWAEWWVHPNSVASIEAGLLRTKDINEPQNITISAEYTERGVTLDGSTVVQISLPQILYVPTEYETIQEAIDAAKHRDTVIVAPGTYTGDGNRDIDFLGKAITVRSENGPETCIIDCNGTEAEAHRGFYFHNNEDANSVLDGFTITNGYVFVAPAGGSPGDGGGGICCWDSSPTITNCIITGNHAGAYRSDGGGISCIMSSPVITNCTFSGNSADWDGGGMYNSDNSNPTVTNCIFSGNLATDGGGICNYENSSPMVTNCTFSENSAEWHGGAMYNYYSSPTVTDCTFSGNEADLGGGIYCDRSSPALTNCIFTGNSAEAFSDSPLWDSGDGGGMYNSDNSNPTVTNCIFSGNSAEAGGGMCNNYSSPTVTNCLFSSNSAEFGGGIYCNGSSPTITNCTFSGNSALNGNALACDSWRQLYPSNVQMTNCILADGGSEIWNNDDSTIIITYSDVQGSWLGIGNIDANPLFVDAYGPDGIVGTEDDNLRLLEGSPCIDAGTDGGVYTDIEGNIRPFDFPGVDNNGELPEFDMGAYEAMVSCFGVNHIKIGTKADKKGNKVELKGAFDPASPIDLVRDDVAYIIDDGLGNALAFLIPAGSFKPEGKPDKQKFKFDSPRGSQPDINARFDFDKCKFELKAKKVPNTDEITGTTLTIELWAGANVAQEVVQVEVKRKHLEFKREPKLSCCPKCKGIALLEVTSTDPFTGDEYVLLFEPDPGKEKLKRKTFVDDGVNGRVKIDTSCSKPLEVGDVFGAYTVTDLIKIFDD